MGSGQGSFGFTIGERKQYTWTNIDQKKATGSLLASIGGDVILSAGNTYIASDVTANSHQHIK